MDSDQIDSDDAEIEQQKNQNLPGQLCIDAIINAKNDADPFDDISIYNNEEINDNSSIKVRKIDILLTEALQIK